MGKHSPAREESARTASFSLIEKEHSVAGDACPWPAPAAGQAGSLCTHCGQGVLDYDGLLNLYCPNCRYVEAGCFT